MNPIDFELKNQLQLHEKPTPIIAAFWHSVNLKSHAHKGMNLMGPGQTLSEIMTRLCQITAGHQFN